MEKIYSRKRFKRINKKYKFIILIIVITVMETFLVTLIILFNLSFSLLIFPFFIIPALFAYVILMQEKRVQEIERSAPDFLRQLSSMLQVGLSFEKT